MRETKFTVREFAAINKKVVGVFTIKNHEENLLTSLALPISSWTTGSGRGMRKFPVPVWAIEVERDAANRLDKLWRESSRVYAPLPPAVRKEVTLLFKANPKMKKVIACAATPKEILHFAGKKNGITLVSLLCDGFNKKALRDVETWAIVNKSPYSLSVYDSYDIGWDHKPEGSLRVADHWNWLNDGEYHCKTADGFTNGWALGIRKDNMYTILKKYT